MPSEDIPSAISWEVVRLLRAERALRGISMNGVAKKSGLSQSMVSLVERGLRTPTLDTLLRIANALDVDLWRVMKKADVRTGREQIRPNR